MLRTRRIYCLLLALFLAGNTLVLAGHYNTHGKSTVEQCLLCASHVNPHSAVPVQAYQVSSPYDYPVAVESRAVEQPKDVTLTRPQPRAPPTAA